MARTIKDYLDNFQETWTPDVLQPWMPRPTLQDVSMGYAYVDPSYQSDGGSSYLVTVDPYQELYKAIARGEVVPTAEDWSQMFNTNNGIDEQEWNTLSPEVRAWAQQNPQAFMTQVLKMRNKANGDLLSMGAEGGFQNLDKVGLANGRMDYSNAGYMDINDEWYDSMDFWGPMLVGAFAGAAGAGWLGGPAAEGAGAAAGAGLADIPVASAAERAFLATGLTPETLPFFDAAAGWINPLTGEVMTEQAALQALTPFASDPTVMAQLTNYANTVGGGMDLASAGGGGLSNMLQGTNITPSQITQTLATQGIKGVASLLSGAGLANTAINAILSNLQKNSSRDDFNQMLDTITSGITNANQLRDLAPIARQQLSSREGLDQALGGLDRLDELTANPESHPGYAAAAAGSRGLEGLYNDPMGNPMIAASTRLMEENASRRSVAGRGLQAGSYPAELQDALLSSISSNFGNLAGGYSKGVDSGSNFYKTSLSGLGDLISGGVNTYNANTYRGNASANAANAHLSALGGAYRDAASPMWNMYKDTNLTGANIRNATGGGIDFTPIVNKGIDWLSNNIFGSN